MSYNFFDADGSVLSADSDIVGGKHRPIVDFGAVSGSVLSFQGTSPWVMSGTLTPSGNQSVSGTVNIGTMPGSVLAFQGSAPWQVYGSVQGSFSPSGNQSVSGTVTTNQGTSPWIITGSVQGAFTPSGNQSVSGTVGASLLGVSIEGNANDSEASVLTGVVATGAHIMVLNAQGTFDRVRAGSTVGSLRMSMVDGVSASVMSSIPSSMLAGASIFGQLPGGTAVLGSVAALQGTNPWFIRGSVSGVVDINGYGPGSLITGLSGTIRSSVFSSIPSSMLVGTYGQRNDTVASYLGGDKTWGQISTDSAGRQLIRPFAAEEARIEGYSSTVNTSQTTLVPAAGAGLRNYITDVWFANTGSVATLITFKDGAGSVLGYTIAPANSGSNLPGLVTPIRTGANATFDIQASTGVSVLFGTVKGFKAP